MNKRNHYEAREYYFHSTIVKSYKDNRSCGYQKTKHWNKSKDKYDDSNRSDEWESLTSMNKTNDEKSYNCEYSICECNDRLSLEK